MKKKKQNKNIIVGSIVFLVLVGGLSLFAIPNIFATNYESLNFEASNSKISDEEEKSIEQINTHIKTPEAVKAIYMTACVVGTPSFRQELVDIAESTEINSIIIDIKDFSGSISFPTSNPDWQYAWEAANCGTKDMKEFIEELHDKGIYVLGRITVFQDPLYTKMHPELAVKRASDGGVWRDHKGLAFIEVGAKEYWDHLIELAEESYGLGFDEINFDYVRFPSDGNMNDIYYPFSNSIITANPINGKAMALEGFFKYLDEKLRPDLTAENRMIISADLFGMTATNSDDLNIGQVLERTLPHFDYVAPMVYPSHYPNGFNGYSNPNNYPYEVVQFSMSTAVGRIEDLLNSSTTPLEIKNKFDVQQLRPWLQDFDYGGDYGPTEVRKQIQATYDSGLTSWMLWAPSNRYTKSALLSQ